MRSGIFLTISAVGGLFAQSLSWWDSLEGVSDTVLRGFHRMLAALPERIV